MHRMHCLHLHGGRGIIGPTNLFWRISNRVSCWVRILCHCLTGPLNLSHNLMVKTYMFRERIWTIPFLFYSVRILHLQVETCIWKVVLKGTIYWLLMGTRRPYPIFQILSNL